MRRRIYLMMLTVMLIGLFAAVPARTQTSNHGSWIAEIPFEFNVGNVTLPAGKYSVSQISPASDRVVLQLKGQEGAGALVQMNSVIGQAQDAKLIFRRYGNRYFFAQAWSTGDNIGLETPKSRNERATQRELASIKLRIEEVALISRAN